MATFIFDNSFDSYDFSIHEDLTYSESEKETIEFISSEYLISRYNVYALAYFIKTEVPPINEYFSKAEKKETKKFFESGMAIDSISFSNTYGKQFKIVDADLIERILKMVHIRSAFASGEGKRGIKKLIAKRLYKQLTETLEQKVWDAKIIIGLLFAEYKIGPFDSPILTKKEYGPDGYHKYLEDNIRSFLTD